jgi:hypothetical protein
VFRSETPRAQSHSDGQRSRAANSRVGSYRPASRMAARFTCRREHSRPRVILRASSGWLTPQPYPRSTNAPTPRRSSSMPGSHRAPKYILIPALVVPKCPMAGDRGQAPPVGPTMRTCTDERLLRPALAPCVAVSRGRPCRTLCLVKLTGGSELGNDLLRRSCRSSVAGGDLQDRHDEAREILRHSERDHPPSPRRSGAGRTVDHPSEVGGII